MRAAPARAVARVTRPVELTLPQLSARGSATTATTSGTTAFPPITALAKRLRTPQKIFSWVRQNVISVPLWGATQGAADCYETRQCSADDTALLLGALLAARGIKTRYERGVVELSVAQFKSAMGAFSSLSAALAMASSGGIPLAEVVNSKDQPVGVELGTVWVEAYFSPAAKQKPRWVALDAYLKPLRFIAPVSLTSATGVSDAAFRKLAESAKTENSLPAVTSLNVSAISSAVSSWDKKIAAKERAMARQGKTVGQFLGGLAANVPASSRLAGPEGKVLRVVTSTTALPAGDYDIVTVTVGPDITLNIQMTLLSMQRLTVGYVPASAADEAVIKKHGGLYKTPAFAVSLKPVVYLGGVPEAVGESVEFGYSELLTYRYAEPDSASISTATHYLPVGGYAAFGVATGPIIGGYLGVDLPAWKSTISRLAAGKTVDADDILGEILSIHAREYYGMMDTADLTVANQLNTRLVARPREMFMSYFPAFEASGTVNGSGMNMDLQSVTLSIESATGSASATASALTLAGMISSRLEATIFEAGEQTPAVSTVSVLANGLTHGTPIAIVDSWNAATTPGKLALPVADQDDIQSAAASGYLVAATSRLVTSAGWSGAVWASISRQGYGYEIAGGLAGGSTTEQTPQMNLWQSVADGLSSLTPDTEGLTGSIAVRIAPALNLLGIGLSGYEAHQTETEVIDETGSPLKGLEAGLTSFGVSLATGAVIAGGTALLLASLATVPVTAPLLLTADAFAVMNAVTIALVGNLMSGALVDAIKRSE